MLCTVSICRAQQAVSNRGPFGRAGRKLHRNPVETFAVQFMQRSVEFRRVRLRLFRHTLPDGSYRVIVEPKICATPFLRQVAAVDQDDARLGTVVLAMLPWRSVSC